MRKAKILSHKNRTLFGENISQSWGNLYILDKLLAKHKPGIIQELGCGSGVLSTYFGIYAFINYSRFVTYDIQKPKIMTLALFNFIRGDVYEKRDRILLENNAFKNPMIFIDADDPKSKLLKKLIPGLKKGTIVVAHDFNDGKNKPIKWGWSEKNIEKYDCVQPLLPYYYWNRELNGRTYYGIIV